MPDVTHGEVKGIHMRNIHCLKFHRTFRDVGRILCCKICLFYFNLKNNRVNKNNRELNFFIANRYYKMCKGTIFLYFTADFFFKFYSLVRQIMRVDLKKYFSLNF